MKLKHDHPVTGGAPPAPPTGPPEPTVDEGPMRSELLRQIAALESEHAALAARVDPWRPRRTNPRRGPALQGSANLEQVRDELLRAVRELQDQHG